MITVKHYQLYVMTLTLQWIVGLHQPMRRKFAACSAPAERRLTLLIT